MPEFMPLNDFIIRELEYKDAGNGVRVSQLAASLWWSESLIRKRLQKIAVKWQIVVYQPATKTWHLVIKD